MLSRLKKAIIVFDETIRWIIIIGILLIMIIIAIFVVCGIEFSLLNFYNVGGILSGVFAGLAFAGVIFSLYNQHRQFRKQQKNFDRQLRIAQDQFKLQTKSNDIRRFEDTFFRMVSLQLDIVNGLEYSYIRENNGESITIKGRQIFKFIFTEKHLYSILEENNSNRYKKSGDKAFTIKGSEKSKYSLQDILDEQGLSVYNKTDFIGILDHYFRNLYRIIKFVHQQDSNLLSYEDKYKYISNNVRSILSEYELIMLFYNCLTRTGYNKFKPLIERYTLFKNIQENHFTEINDPLEAEYINKIFPTNKFEEYLDIDDTIIVDEDKDEDKDGIDNIIKYKLQAFYKEDEIIGKQEYYKKLRKEQEEREESYHKNIKQN